MWLLLTHLSQHALQNSVVPFTKSIAPGVIWCHEEVLHRNESTNLHHQIRCKLSTSVTQYILRESDSGEDFQQCFHDPLHLNLGERNCFRLPSGAVYNGQDLPVALIRYWGQWSNQISGYSVKGILDQRHESQWYHGNPPFGDDPLADVTWLAESADVISYPWLKEVALYSVSCFLRSKMTSNNLFVCQFDHGLLILGQNDDFIHLIRVICVDTA